MAILTAKEICKIEKVLKTINKTEIMTTWQTVKIIKILACSKTESSDVNGNPSKLFCGFQQTDSKAPVGRQGTQNSQHSTKGEQSGGTDTTGPQGLL